MTSYFASLLEIVGDESPNGAKVGGEWLLNMNFDEDISEYTGGLVYPHLDGGKNDTAPRKVNHENDQEAINESVMKMQDTSIDSFTLPEMEDTIEDVFVKKENESEQMSDSEIIVYNSDNRDFESDIFVKKNEQSDPKSNKNKVKIGKGQRIGGLYCLVTEIADYAIF